MHDRGSPGGPEGPWLAQNWDWYADAPERCVVWSAAVEGALATMTEAGSWPRSGSRRRLAVALNILYHERDGRGELGVLCTCAARLLGQRRASTMRGRCCGTPTGIELHNGARCEGGGAHFELSPAGVARVEPRDGLLAHSNHFLDATLGAGEAEQPSDWMPGSRSRLEAAVRAAPGDLGEGLALLASHDSDPQAICRHDEPSGEPNTPLVGTVVSVAMRRASPSCVWPQAAV
jgi:isopenicillin-N N-acyltransferase-like protein